ncbi:shikimate dehydrogenase [Aestuariibius sp. 2305UL40-4]|uniref:shikimate dehydrogenase n=1 Tax=Aestuariibius violaceus TaxID=3234132 RepID=UPI00345E96ED
MSARVPLAGVVGAPVGHSLSPRLHGAWLSRYGIAGHYVPFHVAPSDFEEALRAMPKMGVVGVNVTIPHKVAALELADKASDAARAIGAANMLTFGADGSVEAENTDHYGFMANLRAGAPDWRAAGTRALVLGAGGAARAVLYALCEAGVAEIYLVNRTRETAERLAEVFVDPVRVAPWEDASDLLGAVDLVVNTTSLGMTGQPPLTFPLDGLRAGQVVTDLVYAPLETELLRAARAAGAMAVDGLGMLLHQAVPAFERWFGQRPDVDEDLRRTVLG